MARLEGVTAIAKYLSLSESTVMDLILRQGLPAKKDQKSATWSAESGAIDRWITGGKKLPPKKAKPSGEGVKAGKGGRGKVK